MAIIDLTSDLSENEAEFSDSEEVDEFPYKCQHCPEQFRQMSEAQTHFFGAHQNSEEDHLKIKEEAIPENHGSETNISGIEGSEFSDSEEVDEFPYKCQQCPEKFRQMCEAQTHFFGAHQNSEVDHLEIKEEAISENHYPENDISENLVSQNIISENYDPEDDIFENYVSEKFVSENHVSENDIYEICDSENDIPGNEGSENKNYKNYVSENSAPENYGSKSDDSENKCPSHDISESDDSQVDTSEKKSDPYQVEIERPKIDKPAKNSLSGQNHEKPKPLIPTPSFRVVKSENFSSENDFSKNHVYENDISENNVSEDDTRIIQAHLYQEELEKLKRGIDKPPKKSCEKVLKRFPGQNHEKTLIQTPGFQVRRFESDKFENNNEIIEGGETDIDIQNIEDNLETYNCLR